MVNSINTDKKRRLLFLKNLEKRLKLKKIINNVNVSETERYKAQLKLQKLPRNSLSTRIKNRCILTGRTHAIVGPFNLSRVKLRDLISNGKITGFKKSVW
tara:strand:+ start:1593 stop:1892 length:300 start_codon:yes stop_codon:yes gene_type:complete